jgi:general stress protein 26
MRGLACIPDNAISGECAVHSPQELEDSFWHHLGRHPVVMLGLEHEEGHSRPMTAQLEAGQGPLWFFSSKDSSLYQSLLSGNRAVAAFVAKGHELFATLSGTLVVDEDRQVIERLWNRFVAAWYEGGKEDPKLALLRFDAADLQVWMNDVSVVSGIKLLLGADPKKELAGNEAKIRI